MLHSPFNTFIFMCKKGWWYIFLSFEVMNDRIFYINALLYSINCTGYNCKQIFMIFCFLSNEMHNKENTRNWSQWYVAWRSILQEIGFGGQKCGAHGRPALPPSQPLIYIKNMGFPHLRFGGWIKVGKWEESRRKVKRIGKKKWRSFELWTTEQGKLFWKVKKYY